MTKSPHTISRDELIRFVEAERWTRYASSSTIDDVKVLEFSTRRMYKVTVNGEVVYNGQSPTEAVNAYNEAC